MGKTHLVLVLVLLLILNSSCTDNSMTISQEDCNKNWAICLVFPNNSYVEESFPIKLAILDSGINENAGNLNIRIEKSFNTLTGSTNTIDEFGHGTMIASIIAAEKNNNSFRGLNPNVSIYDVQVLDEKGNGKIENVVEGIAWSIENNVDIINLSFGYSKNNPLLKQAINQAMDKGIIVVASAGNTLGISTDYPAKYPGVYSISAVDKNLNKYIFAGEGKVDFVAPGVDIPVINNKGKKEIQSGTSFATAYASGIISLLLAKEKGNENLKENIKDNTKYLGSEEKFGNGLLQINRRK